MTKPKVYLVMRWSKEYTPTHVRRLAAQITDCDVVALADIPVIMAPQNILLKYDYPGWWSKMELFRPDIEGDLFYMDLDSTVLGPVANLARVGNTTMLRDFYRADGLQSSVMYLTMEDRARVWQAWCGKEQEIISRFSVKRPGHNGDQNFLEEVLGVESSVLRWQDTHPGAICSYKVHVQPSGKVPEGTRILVFHGKPKPWNLATELV